MTTPSLHDLMDHPPQDPEPAADPTLTILVMRRIRRIRLARRATGVLAVVVLLMATLPLDAALGATGLGDLASPQLLVDASGLLALTLVILGVSSRHRQARLHSPLHHRTLP